jgi:hypothetical protein
MELNLFGIKVNVELLIVMMLIIFLINIHLVGGCCKVGIKEGFEIAIHDLGAGVNDVLNINDLKWGNVPDNYNDALKDGINSNGPSYMTKDYSGMDIPMPEGKLDYFSNTKFSSECCPSAYTRGEGCACMSHGMITHLNQRGGNRTHGLY